MSDGRAKAAHSILMQVGTSPEGASGQEIRRALSTSHWRRHTTPAERVSPMGPMPSSA